MKIGKRDKKLEKEIKKKIDTLSQQAELMKSNFR